MSYRESLLVPFFVILLSSFLFSQTIWVEAECGIRNQQWATVNDSVPEILQSIRALNPESLSVPNSDPNTWLRFQVNAPDNGQYLAYARVKALDPSSNSVWVRVNNGNWVLWDDIKLSPLPDPVPGTPLPVVPRAQGYGITTPAGRGGTIRKVTNLNDSGPGSLRACVEASGARVCVFEVGGLIELQSPLSIEHPYLTVAGQTAPSPGIMLGKGHGVQVYTHDVLFQHIDIRPGDGPGTNYRNRDALQFNGASSPAERVHNIVLDHVTLAWGMDENLDFWGYIGDVTVRNCIIAQSMRDPFDQLGSDVSYGNLIGAFDQQSQVSIYGSFYAGNRDRQPLSRSHTLFFANNLLYDRVLRFVYLSNRDHNGSGGFATNSTVVGNAFVEGPDMSFSLPHERPITFDQTGQLSASQLYLADNWWSEQSYASQWGYVKDANPAIEAPEAPVWVPGFDYLTDKDDIIDYVVDQAGSRPRDRNVLDQSLFDKFALGQKVVVGCVEGCPIEVGGWPNFPATYRPLDLPPNPHGDDDNDGYTNLEEWLHAYARTVETGEGEYVWDQMRHSSAGATPLSLNLQSGVNTIDFAVREPGLFIDKLLLSTSPMTPQGPGMTGFGCDTSFNQNPVCYLPDDWYSLDLGAVGLSGSSCYDSLTQSMSMAASGADIWNTQDAFQFAYQIHPGSQDFEVQAQVSSLDNTDPWAKAGVMIRDGLFPEAANVMMFITASGRWSFQRRLSEADTTASTKSPVATLSLPYWVKLQKDGQTFRGMVSPDGQNWTTVEQIQLAVGPNIQIGLAVTSHNNSQLTNATFVEPVVRPYTGENTFPVELLAFEVVPDFDNRLVEVHWSTASEQNNAAFTIERSVDNMLFNPLASVSSQGDGAQLRQYRWDDEAPLNGRSYYRLKQTDLDGTFRIYPSVEVNFQQVSGLRMQLYPNPLPRTELLRTEVWSEGSDPLLFQLFNPMGQEVWAKSLQPAQSGLGSYAFSLPHLAPGLYMFKVSSTQGLNSRFVSKALWIR